MSNLAYRQNVIRFSLYDTNNTPLVDGNLFMVSFTVSSFATAWTVINLTFDANPIPAADINSNDITVQGTNGSITVSTPSALLSIAFAGNGSGTVTSTSPDSRINCIKGSSSGCYADYPVGASVTLAATGDRKSLFTGWSNGITSSNPVTFSMDANKSVTANFDPNFKVKLLPGGTLFAGIQDAYASITSGNVMIQAQTWSFLEELLLGNDTVVTLIGGMDASYNPTAGYSTVKSLTVRTGSAVIGNITIK